MNVVGDGAKEALDNIVKELNGKRSVFVAAFLQTIVHAEIQNCCHFTVDSFSLRTRKWCDH